MGFLDNSSITVDAVLTKRGREILKDGGSLNITSFTVSDVGVDYSLFNVNHPSGSAFYGEAIENLPMLEASVHAEYNTRNRLVTLSQPTIAMPALIIGNLDSDGVSKTFNEGDGAQTITVTLTGFTSTRNMGYTLIVNDPALFSVSGATLQKSLSGTGRGAAGIYTQDINNVQQYHFSGDSFTLSALQHDEVGRQSLITILDEETGAQAQFAAINNITKDDRAILSTGGTGA
jgi:hypothetical protein